MQRGQKWDKHTLFGIISLFVAAVGLSGVVYGSDLTGRVIWCVVWGLIAWFWLSKKIRISGRGSDPKQS